ncbi:ATP-binding protein, partial [Thermodesulfobacteriota bacterium]
QGKRSLFQVTADLQSLATRERELKALDDAMQECGLRQATVITLNEEERLETESGRIQILPAWQWALGSNKIF